MRQPTQWTWIAVIFLAVPGAAAEPDQPPAPAQPMVLMTSATSCCTGVALHIHTVQLVPGTQDLVIQTPVRETTLVNGRVIEQNRVVEERRQISVLKPTPGPVVEVPLEGTLVSVVDLKGKSVAPNRVAQVLKKDTAVLVSITGAVDPYFLQTTKPGTLVVLLPANLLYPQSPPAIELIPQPPKGNANEPPLAPPRPK
jgi:hypothetical protein